MGVFKKRKPKPSSATMERLDSAKAEHDEQVRKYNEALATKRKLEQALARNHIAQLMLEALSAERRDT